METQTIISINWIIIGWHAYFADKPRDFLIVRDKTPWQIFYRETGLYGMISHSAASKYTFAGEGDWIQTDMDGTRVERYMKSHAKPETWKKMSKAFEETHQVGMICDGASLHVIDKAPDVREKRIHYFMDDFPENLHASYQKACRLLRYLERMKGEKMDKVNV